MVLNAVSNVAHVVILAKTKVTRGIFFKQSKSSIQRSHPPERRLKDHLKDCENPALFHLPVYAVQKRSWVRFLLLNKFIELCKLNN